MVNLTFTSFKFIEFIKLKYNCSLSSYYTKCINVKK